MTIVHSVDAYIKNRIESLFLVYRRQRGLVGSGAMAGELIFSIGCQTEGSAPDVPHLICSV